MLEKVADLLNGAADEILRLRSPPSSKWLDSWCPDSLSPNWGKCAMKELEMLQRDIDALLESVRSGWADMTAAERAELRQSITALVEQLQQLLSRMP
jgi:hypothetical protein